MPTINWKKYIVAAAKAEEFDVATGDFASLSIEPAEKFHYFYHTGDRRLIKNFLLREGAQVDTLCSVILVEKDGALTPRLRFWKRDKTAPKADEPTGEDLIATTSTVTAKASVGLDDCWENYWKLTEFLRSCQQLRLPAADFLITPIEDIPLLTALEGHDKEAVLAAVKVHLGNSLSDRDVRMLVDRKAALSEFERLLDDDGHFDGLASESGGKERVWQQFFESNPWIFGYGLTLVACSAVSEERLEQITSGTNLYGGAGKRADAAMRTRGFIQSLLFGEIKHHRTDLLVQSAYRPPDVYRVSNEMSGAVAQVQKTAHKAVKKLQDLHRQHDPTGEFQFEVSTVKPRQVVVAGHLEQLAPGGVVNIEQQSSFELYRRSQQDVEVLTFDELLARARFIADSDGA